MLENKFFVMEDGETILPYDAASLTENYYDPKAFEPIGKGVILHVDGVLLDCSFDNPDDVFYFYRRIRKQKENENV
jgi:hypothetical protein